MQSFFVRVVVVLVLVIAASVAPPLAEMPAAQDPDVLARIATTLQEIRVDLDKLRKDVIAQMNVTAVTNLDAAISALSGELQRALESRIPLETELVKLRGLSTMMELPPVEQTTFKTTGEALDNLNRRIEEIKHTLTSRRAQLAAMEKVLDDQINRKGKE